jgi:hypothetical protein
VVVGCHARGISNCVPHGMFWAGECS